MNNHDDNVLKNLTIIIYINVSSYQHTFIITYNIALCLKVYYVGFNTYEFDVITYIMVIKTFFVILNYN